MTTAMKSGQKVILVLIDGLSWWVARDCTGYLSGLMEAGLATRYCLSSALPSLSRPLYECILTGEPPVRSGITHNQFTRSSVLPSIFSLAQSQGLTTAAAAYHWMSELYNQGPYDPIRDRFTAAPEKPIQYGVFYHLDHYPDEHLLLDAEWLRRAHDPDFLLIHPMNVDDAGHHFGGDSAEYRNSARKFDNLLSMLMPHWIELGYQIVVTSDHGMNVDRSHGGTLDCERQVPLWLIGSAFSHQPDVVVAQTELCGLMADLLHLQHSKTGNKALLA